MTPIDRRTFTTGALAALAVRPAPTSDHLLYFGYVDRLRYWHVHRVHLPANPVSSLELQRLLVNSLATPV